MLKLKHIKALGIKWVILIVAIFPIYGIITYASLYNILLISLVLLGVTYVVGDLFILKRFGIIVTSIADLILSFGILYVFGFVINGIPVQTFTPAVAATGFIVAFETFFHIYMENYVLKLGPHVYDKSRQTFVPKKLRVEFSDELSPHEGGKKEGQPEHTHNPDKETEKE